MELKISLPVYAMFLVHVPVLFESVLPGAACVLVVSQAKAKLVLLFGRIECALLLVFSILDTASWVSGLSNLRLPPDDSVLLTYI